MKWIIYSICFFAMALQLGCTSVGVNVQTRPEPAEVFIHDNSGSRRSIGTTPVKIPMDDIRAMEGGIIRLDIEKQGFVKEHIYVNKANFGVNARVDVEMTPLANWSKVYQDDQANKYLSEVASLAAQIQSATVKREFGRAETMAKQMVDRYPKLDVAWSLLGNIYYLQKRAGDALEAYNKAFLLNPTNVETKNLINKLKGIEF